MKKYVLMCGSGGSPIALLSTIIPTT